MEYFTLKWIDTPGRTPGLRGALRLLDQRLLPHQVLYRDYSDYREVADAIREMVVRGAPAIGAAAAYGMALAADAGAALDEAARSLRAARPTAVNLGWALDRVLGVTRALPDATLTELFAAVLAEAHAIADEDVRANRAIGQHALALIPDKAVFIHHCNTGTLATVGYGTALGIIRAAHEAGKEVFVYVDETRPRLQGARLTCWELDQLGIPHALIADGASGFVMQRRHVDLAVVGCDRVAANGDTANKIGTFNLALAAQAHNVPLYVAAPTSTIDLNTPRGADIEIEERDPAEVTLINGECIAPAGTPVFTPAFDVTPAEYIRAIVTEVGIAQPPYQASLAQLVALAHLKRNEIISGG